MFRRMPIGLTAVFMAACSLAAQAQTAAPKPATPPAAAAEDRAPGLYLTWKTDMGNISCKLFEKESPITVGKMVGLAIGKISYIDPRTGKPNKNKFFDGLTFHRVIPQFMIQGGDPLGNGVGGPGGPGFPFKNEKTPGLDFDVPGRLAMANAGPDTNSSQFFITEVPYPALNGGYTIWGQCDNVDVVKMIARVPANSENKPNKPVHIIKAVVERVGPVPPNAPESMPTVHHTPATTTKTPAKTTPSTGVKKATPKPPASSSQ
jgi:peptidyl-prolyl cis-trans isomerase A (cyclophilin A)